MKAKQGMKMLASGEAIAFPELKLEPGVSLLDDIAHPKCPIKASVVEEWKSELSRSPKNDRRVRLLVQLGESEIAAHWPSRAEKYLSEASRLASSTNPDGGLAQFDLALTTYFQGKYAAACAQFQDILTHPKMGLDLRQAQSYFRYVRMAKGYHEAHAKLGIPQQPAIDPLNGPNAVALALEALGVQKSTEEIRSTIPFNGEGTNIYDIQQSLGRLGVEGVPLVLSEVGLQEVPKPVLAQVESDHIVTILDANTNGVTYATSGPGHAQSFEHVATWQQWRAMEATQYLAIATEGSTELLAMRNLPTEREQSVHIALASIGSSTAARLIEAEELLSRLSANYAVMTYLPMAAPTAGLRPSSPNDHTTACPKCMSPTASPVPNSPVAVGATATADPTTITSGEEQYTAPSGIHVYNPIGPSVDFYPMYLSLTNSVPTGFGSGWSHPYNYRVIDNTYDFHNTVSWLVLPNGKRIPLDTRNVVVPDIQFTNTASIRLPLKGYPFEVKWVANGTGGTTYFKIVDKAGTTISFPNNNGGGRNLKRPNRITNIHGQYITLEWAYKNLAQEDIDAFGSSWVYDLSAIKDSNGSELLSFGYSTWDQSYSYLSSVTDNQQRSIFYAVQANSIPVPHVTPTDYGYNLQQVSTISPSTATNPTVLYQYGYSNLNTGGYGTFYPYLHTISTISPTGSGSTTATINYDSYGQVTDIIDGNGNQSKLYLGKDINLNANSNQSTVYVMNAAKSAAIKKYAMEFDSHGNMAKVIDANGTASYTKYFADPQNPFKPSQVTDALSHSSLYTWNVYNDMLTSQSPKGTVTTIHYKSIAGDFGNFPTRPDSVQEGTKTSTTLDWLGHQLRNIYSPIPGNIGSNLRQTTSLSYTAMDNVKTVTSPGNQASSTHTTTYEYVTDGSYTQTEKLGQPIYISDTLGHKVHLRYDSFGNVTESWDESGHHYYATYTPYARQVATVKMPKTGQPVGGGLDNTTTNTYLYEGGPLMSWVQRDELGNQIDTGTYHYGYEGETLQAYSPEETQNATYTTAYQLNSLSSSLSNDSTTYKYDLSGRCYEADYPDGSYESATFNNNGAVLTSRDRRAQVRSYSYLDVDGQLSDVAYTGNAAYNVHLNYDSYGRLQSLTDQAGSETYAYDDLNFASSVSRIYTGVPQQQIIYTYNPDGSRKTMSIPGSTWTYAYDSAGRPTSMSTPYGSVAYTYQPDDLLSTRKIYNATLATPIGETDFAYNSLSLLGSDGTSGAGLMNKAGFNAGTTVSNFTNLVYDGAQRLKSMSISVPTVGSQTGTVSYSYTSGRMTQESGTRFGGYTNNFVYDGNGNPTSVWGQTRSYNNANQRTGTGWTYDNGGNQTGSGVGALKFAHDPDGHVTSMFYTQGQPDFTAGYRADGLRAWKQSALTNNAKLYYLYDGGNPVLEFDASGNRVATNVYGPDGLVCRDVPNAAGTGGTSAAAKGGASSNSLTSGTANSVTTFYLFDPQGSISERLDSNGAVLSHSAYAAYGYSPSYNATTGENHTATFTDPFGYNAKWGYYQDREHNFYLCQQRYYDRDGGRWLTPDPISYAGGMNLYAYCRSNPVGAADPWGLLTFTGVSEAFVGGVRGTIKMAADLATTNIPELWKDVVESFISGHQMTGDAVLYQYHLLNGDHTECDRIENEMVGFGLFVLVTEGIAKGASGLRGVAKPPIVAPPVVPPPVVEPLGGPTTPTGTVPYPDPANVPGGYNPLEGGRHWRGPEGDTLSPDPDSIKHGPHWDSWTPGTKPSKGTSGGNKTRLVPGEPGWPPMWWKQK